MASSQSPASAEGSSRSFRPRLPPSMHGPLIGKPSESSRRPRRSSPPPMFGSGMFDTSNPKPPKPLIKLDKKRKDKTLPMLLSSPSPTSHHRTTSAATQTRSTAIIPSPTDVLDHNQGDKPSSCPSFPENPTESEKSWGGMPKSVPSLALEDRMWLLAEESFDDGWLADDSYGEGETTPPSPMHFAALSRPSSVTPGGDLVPSLVRDGTRGSRTRLNTPAGNTFIALDSHSLGHYEQLSAPGSGSKQRWIGEWNHGDMQEVINKLRSLK
ncbi:hypothetical protein K438DRAFT_534897 [Mycena galopus ATCC 62051]|nr:hypothetical protein K438DRAFT_534897 [Mycena galopus ATCC 62051]